MGSPDPGGRYRRDGRRTMRHIRSKPRVAGSMSRIAATSNNVYIAGRRVAPLFGEAIPAWEHIEREPPVGGNASTETRAIVYDGCVRAPIVFQSKLERAW